MWVRARQGFRTGRMLSISGKDQILDGTDRLLGSPTHDGALLAESTYVAQLQ